MATGAFDATTSAVGTVGDRVLLSWDAPVGDWSSATPTIALNRATGNPSFDVDDGFTLTDRVIGVDTTQRPVVAAALATPSITADMQITEPLDEFVFKDQIFQATLTVGYLTESTNDTGAAAAVAMTNGSTRVGLSSVDALKTELSITGTSDDALLQDVLLRASDRIVRLCNRVPEVVGTVPEFYKQTYVETLSGDGDRDLVLRHGPVISITSIATLDSDGTSTPIETTEFRFDPLASITSRITDDDLGFFIGAPGFGSFNGIVFRREPRFPRGVRNIVVTYVAGHTPTTWPDDLEYAALRVSSDMFKGRKRDRGLSGEGIGDYTWTARTPFEASQEFANLISPVIRKFIT